MPSKFIEQVNDTASCPTKEEVNAAYEWALQASTQNPNDKYATGILVALAWLKGETETAPNS